MKKTLILTAFGIGFSLFSMQAQAFTWQKVSNLDIAKADFAVSNSLIVNWNDQELLSLLKGAGNTSATAVTISLPTPEGNTATFKVWKNDLLPAALQRKYPGISTYSGAGIDNPTATLKMDYSPLGWHVMVFNGGNTYLINPYQLRAADNYTVFYRNDYEQPAGSMQPCAVTSENLGLSNDDKVTYNGGQTAAKTATGFNKQYRLALACTPQYAQAVAGSTATREEVLEAMTTSINRVNGIYEKETGVTMQFIPNEDTLIFTDATFTYYSNNDGEAMLSQNNSLLNNYIGSSNYDIGHVFSTGGGGIAGLGVVCTSYKGEGVTGSSDPVGDPFDVDYVAHEMGHQFGANHNFNSCSGTENQSTAYEPGGGTSIMGYAGICGTANNVQMHSDAFFNFGSLGEIRTFLVSGYGTQCGVKLDSNIVSPPLSLPFSTTYAIPRLTPFELTGISVSPQNGGTVTYGWEESDLGNFQQSDANAASFTAGPAFRTVIPSSDTVRVFPEMANVLQKNYTAKGEHLSKVARTLTFKYIVKEVDANGFGTFNYTDNNQSITVVNTDTGFQVTEPNTAGATYTAGSSVTVSWLTAGTDQSPINTSAVDIYVSADSGQTFPYLIASNVANNGSALVNLPNVNSENAFIKVKGHENIFFNVNPVSFKITGATGTGVNNVNAASSVLTVYPNPASEALTIAAIQNNLNGNIQLYNTLGQLVFQGSVNNNAQYTLSVSGMASGIYLLRYNTQAGKSYAQQIVIKH